MGKTIQPLSERTQLEQFVVNAPRMRIAGSAAFQAVKAATGLLVEICAMAVGVLRAMIVAAVVLKK